MTNPAAGLSCIDLEQHMAAINGRQAKPDHEGQLLYPTTATSFHTAFNNWFCTPFAAYNYYILSIS